MEQKILVITGGTGGIGSAMVRKMAKRGHKVVLTYLKEEEKKLADDLLAEIQRDTECTGFAVQADVSNYEDMKALINRTIETYGHIDVMVNNAGIFPRAKPFHEVDLAQINAIIRINLLGVMYGTHIVLPHMLEYGGGCIVNTASIAGLWASDGQASYGTSKAGVIGFTRNIAKEYGYKKIRCNAIAPGFINTEMLSAEIKKAGDGGMEDQVPLGRLGTPDDIAECLDYIVHSDYLTGQTISPNGGLFMH